MDYKKISELVALYWEGETTLEQEAVLREFFSIPRPDLPEELQEAAPLFGYFHAEAAKEWEVPAAKVVTLSPWRHWMKYAAVLLVGVGIGYALKQTTVKQHQAEIVMREKEMNDPQKAFEETKKALQLLAKNLNKGATRMQKLSYFNQATSVVEGKEESQPF
ncbi:hypothetical protein [Chitinophaga sp. 212800010-3]|uniref:hypothetical protein n=1 Tax=unclassified Chitinophaga TaxID=2619133 RepID=UPI002DE3F236|nr:DUF4129 domain-containing protein [Chitinophaga sp. 212800010-3]